MSSIVPIACAVLALLFSVAACYPLFSRLFWVRKMLTKPYKIYKQSPVPSSPVLNKAYQLSEESRSSLEYYVVEFDKRSLSDLVFEIRLKSQFQNGHAHLVNYLTVNIIPLFSLLIASFALFANMVPPNQLVGVLGFTIIIIVAIVLVVLLDYTDKVFVQEPINKHLIVIEKALSIKNNEQPQSLMPTNNNGTQSRITLIRNGRRKRLKRY
ncbi:hypothetical protein [Paenibacillus glacialis]|uniref:Uncharacterized protein n=1 Tax=Paenibacillus glacialis TaxID=494026 RepID=A0A168D4Q5_9BACL|nr:hypothetical protein [Paenibacillus glacialis]OAB33866.1 hypothetical protein PGLA_23375 [Paenibacillus glacialis]